MPNKNSDYFYTKQGGSPAPAFQAEEDEHNAPTMREGLYQATTAKSESIARSAATKAGGFGTQYAKPGRKDR